MVIRAKRVGEQTGELAYPSVKRSPAAAKASMFGETGPNGVMRAP